MAWLRRVWARAEAARMRPVCGGVVVCACDAKCSDRAAAASSARASGAARAELRSQRRASAAASTHRVRQGPIAPPPRHVEIRSVKGRWRL